MHRDVPERTLGLAAGLGFGQADVAQQPLGGLPVVLPAGQISERAAGWVCIGNLLPCIHGRDGLLWCFQIS